MPIWLQIAGAILGNKGAMNSTSGNLIKKGLGILNSARGGI